MPNSQKHKLQIVRFLDALKAGSIIGLSVKSLITDYIPTVVTVGTSFLNNPLMSDLVDGQFKVIGKVIKSVSESSESINLLRKTVLSKMTSNLMLEAFGYLSALGSEQGFGVPELKLEIEGPAIQVLLL